VGNKAEKLYGNYEYTGPDQDKIRTERLVRVSRHDSGLLWIGYSFDSRDIHWAARLNT